MSTSRLVYDDASTPTEMTGDALAVGERMRFPAQGINGLSVGATEAFAAYLRTDHAAPSISEQLASRAAALELHLD